MNAMTEAAQTAVDFIRTVDPKLANIFVSQPFQRVNLAKAFAKGLVNDPWEMGLTIIALAELDREERLCANEA